MESRVWRDRQTFVQLIAQLIGDDLSRTGGVVQYYENSTEAARFAGAASSANAAQQWLNSVFYSQPRIDGMFLTDRDGRLVATVPPNRSLTGKDFGSDFWRGSAKESSEPYVSPVHQRPADSRPATDIVGAVRASDKSVVGYFGVSVLVERLGQRLSSIALADQAVCQIIDQNGNSLFDGTFNGNTKEPAMAPDFVRQILQARQGHLERGKDVFSFSPIGSTGWVALIAQPKGIAFKSVYEWRAKMTVLAGWLMALTAVFAWFGGLFYRRQTEASRRLEREVVFNEKILANTPLGIALIDPASQKFVHANEAFRQMAQRFGNSPSPAEILDLAYADVQIAPPDAMTKVLSSGTPFQLIEQPFTDEGGMTHFLNVNLLRLQDSHETTQGILYLIEDKTRDVTLRRELINANAAKDQFLALLSHELRNPLSPVIAMVSELEDDKSEEVREAVAIIRRNVELEARLIDDLLDVTRIAKGKLQLTFEVTNLHDVLRRAHEICLKDIAAKQIETVFRLDAREIHVEGDSARLQQVFWNLIKNSVKFTPANGRITITTRNSGDHEIEVQISDTGIGIEADKTDKIFNAFEQGPTSITRKFGGLGLGLAISKAMVEAHAGRISATSAGANQGSTFTVILKTVPAPKVTTQPGLRSDLPPLPPRERRILVVDDHVDTCAGMKMLLERRGYQITTAFSANQALEKGLAQDFDLVISDIGLPDRSGYDLMRELHTRKGLRGIALSGYGAQSDVSDAHEAGFSDHLTKPIDFDRLEESIRNVLEEEALS